MPNPMTQKLPKLVAVRVLRGADGLRKISGYTIDQSQIPALLRTVHDVLGTVLENAPRPAPWYAQRELVPGDVVVLNESAFKRTVDDWTPYLGTIVEAPGGH
jgi:hypothetical protein